ncbi:MAG TPA: SxtJ family membrane protein [Candidatus Wallbacteria bacterium]|nr:MAG: hypothetical protein BWY32_01203 [bacterium ADurb.Bin243]HPG57150.1 SxtJ family membrane protein [Candidatus Wallbacteria bacterium]
MSKKIEKKDLKAFGLVFGLIFLVICLWPAIFHSLQIRNWALGVSGLFLIPAFFSPAVLATPYKIWMIIGKALGWINTRIILGLIFFGVMMPLGFVMRIFGYNPLAIGYDAGLKTYFVMLPKDKAISLKKQF